VVVDHQGSESAVRKAVEELVRSERVELVLGPYRRSEPYEGRRSRLVFGSWPLVLMGPDLAPVEWCFIRSPLRPVEEDRTICWRCTQRAQ
jgi:hypothetical protein